jgi:hypothetical protein
MGKKEIEGLCIRLGELDAEIERLERELDRLKDLLFSLEGQLKIEGRAMEE